MKKRIILGVLIFAFAAGTLTGCVSQKDYDALSAERDDLQGQVESLTKENEELESKASEYKKELDDTKSELEDANSQIAKMQKKIEEYEALEAVAQEIVEQYVSGDKSDKSDDSDKTTAGDYYEKGLEIGESIGEDIANIDWDAVIDNAVETGVDIATFFNNLVR